MPTAQTNLRGGGDTFRPATTTAAWAAWRAPNVRHQPYRAPAHRPTEKPVTALRALVNAPPLGQTWRVYYYAGAQTIAMRVMTNTVSMSTLYYLHTDHPSATLRTGLGSTSVTTCGHVTCGTLGAVLSRHSYYPYGGVRQQVGTLPTRRTYTGQYADGTGLMFYNARYDAPALGRFKRLISV